MKLSYVRESFDNFSGKASELSRQLALAGIAVIWIFKVSNKIGFNLPNELYKPLFLFCLGLLSDLFQYIYATIAWGIVLRLSKKKKEDDEIKIGRWINYVTWLFFIAKIVFLLIAYWFLLLFVINKV